MAVWLTILRSKTGGERLMMALDASDFAIKVSEAGMRARHPDASVREVFLRAAALRIPKELMLKAYGWHPDEPDNNHANAR
jgi:hypothetical protein